MSDTEEPVQNGFHDADDEVADEDVDHAAAVKMIAVEPEEEAEDEQPDDTAAAEEEATENQVADSDDTGAVTDEGQVAEETTQVIARINTVSFLEGEEPEEAASNQDAVAVTVEVLEGGDDTVDEQDEDAVEEQAASEEPVQQAVADTSEEDRKEEADEEKEPHVENAATPASPARRTPRTPKSGATATPRSNKAAFDFDEAKTASAAGTPRTPRTPKTPKTPLEPKVEASTGEPADVPAEEETTKEVIDADEGNVETVTYEVEEHETEPAKDEAPATPVRTRRESPSPPPRRALEDRSSFSVHRRDEPSPNEYVPYDQDTHKKTVPTRPPTSASFSSWMPAEKPTYQALSPWTVNPAHKYRNEYTSGSTYRPSSTYTSVFDDLVSVGPFAQHLYSTSRMVERSRSRTRERKNALRSHRSASNYFRYTSQGPPPTRTREYSTPPSAYVSRAPSRSGSFASFMDFSSAKQYDLARTASRASLQETNALSRSSSRSDMPYWPGGGGLSRVDSFVRNMQSPYEANVPSTYDVYRPSSRYSLAYTPMNTYSRYYDTADSVLMQLRSAYERRRPVLVHNAYWSHVTDLQRSLSRDRYTPRSRYTGAAYPYEQATNQANLYGTSSYSHMRSGSVPRASAYSSYSPSYQTTYYPMTSTVEARRSRVSTTGLRSSVREPYNRWQQGNVLAGMPLYGDQPYVERRPYTQSFKYF